MTVKPTKQARSEQTLNRILDATEILLETQPFDRLSIQEITTRAGVATGSFYTRFENKNGVLDVLFQRYLEYTEKIAREATIEASHAGGSLEERVTKVCRLLVRTFRTRRGVSRSAQLHFLRFPEQADSEMRQRLGSIYEKIACIILGDGHEIYHPRPSLAARFAVEMATAMCRAKILFPDHPVPAATDLDDEGLIGELTHALMGYLRKNH